MQFTIRVICILLLSSTAFAQMDTLSEADQIKAAIRLKIWQETMDSRLLSRADIAIGYLDLGNDALQETIRNEAGFQKEEHERWLRIKNVEFLEQVSTDWKSVGEQLETVKNLDEFDELFAEADRLLYERSSKVQAQSVE